MLRKITLAPHLNGLNDPALDQLVTHDLREYAQMYQFYTENFAADPSVDIAAVMASAVRGDRDRQITRSNGLRPSDQFNPELAAWLIAGRLMASYLAFQ